MNVRPATSADRTRIAEIARDSYGTSYSLGPEAIEAIVADLFSAAAVTDRLAAPDTRLFVATDGAGAATEIQGFVEATVGDRATIHRLHVHPEARGQGVGALLVERVRNLEGPLAARVLSAAAEGGEFFEQFGLRQTGTDHETIGGETYSVVVFSEPIRAEQ